MTELVEVTEEGEVNLNLHPGQLRAWDAPERIVAVLAGSQSGKTSFGPAWLWHEIENTARPEGGNDYIAATSTYDLFKLKMLPALRDWFEHKLGTGRYWSGDRIIELADPTGRFWARRADDRMWGRIILRSAESGGGLESATARGLARRGGARCVHPGDLRRHPPASVTLARPAADYDHLV